MNTMQPLTHLALSEPDAAAVTGLSAKTLLRLRVRGEGPPYVRIGRQVRYPVAALESWLAEHASSQPGPTDGAA